mgnify:CR=1 FL=1
MDNAGLVDRDDALEHRDLPQILRGCVRASNMRIERALRDLRPDTPLVAVGGIGQKLLKHIGNEDSVISCDWHVRVGPLNELDQLAHRMGGVWIARTLVVNRDVEQEPHRRRISIPSRHQPSQLNQGLESEAISLGRV